MKIVGLLGSNAEISYNRRLLQFIGKHFEKDFAFELLEIKDIPLFNQDDDQTNTPPLQKLIKKIEGADGVIISTPEHNHTITPALKSVLEWLSYKAHPLQAKPVMVIGASYFEQGSSRAQLHLRQILEAPGVSALVFPGNEFLLGHAKSAFDKEGHLKNSQTVNFLETVIQNFLRYVNVVSDIAQPKESLPEEDLHATGQIKTTINNVDMEADDWVEQASEAVNAVSGDTYVRLDRGVLTVDQINNLLRSMPMEITYADDNNQFLYYNKVKPGDEMLASRYPEQVGNPLAACHPEKAIPGVQWVVQQLRAGKEDVVRIPIPFHGPDKYVVHNYAAMHDLNGNYAGINEFILDFKPIVDWYTEATGQMLMPDPDADATTGASATDSTSGASESADATTGASES